MTSQVNSYTLRTAYRSVRMLLNHCCLKPPLLVNTSIRMCRTMGTVRNGKTAQCSWSTHQECSASGISLLGGMSQKYMSTVTKSINESSEHNHEDKDHEEENMPAGIRGHQTYHLLKQSLSDPDYFPTIEQWKDIECKLKSDSVYTVGWQSLFMLCIFEHKHFSCGKSLMDYLETDGQAPNIVTMAIYVALAGESGRSNKLDIITKVYNNIMKETDVLDSFSCSYLIIGYAHTEEWRKCFDFLEMASWSGHVGSHFYSPVIAAAFRNRDSKTAFDLIDKIGQDNLEPHPSVYEEMLNACSRAEISFQDIAEYWNRYRWIPRIEIQPLFNDFFKRDCGENKPTIVEATVSRGVCSSCGLKLRKNIISQQNFQILQSEFLEKALVGDNIYLKSDPKERDRFLNFLKESAPFEVVIDSLNVMGLRGTTGPKIMNLMHVVRELRKKYSKICVIGRQHQLNRYKRELDKLHTVADCFYADDLSKDDPFMLYTAIYSGPQTRIVSKDYMRDHKFLLGREAGDIFRKWQAVRQIAVNWVSPKGKVFFKFPDPHDAIMQNDNNGWHIPFEDGELRTAYKFPNKWLCVRSEQSVMLKSIFKSIPSHRK